MHVECAELSLLGNRQENQDRIKVIADADSLLLIAVDGMGGHAEGERAAEVTVETLNTCFFNVRRPVFDPQGFLASALGRAHEGVVALGTEVALDHKPRATCAVCLVQDAGAFWAHIGDSRIYQIRAGSTYERTRDHSHVELLLREGLISEAEIKDHPMRNFVECCLGGDAPLPDMSITALKRLQPGDILIACTDGLWSGLEDEEISRLMGEDGKPLEESLRALAEVSLAKNAPHSDNTSAVALRWLG